MVTQTTPSLISWYLQNRNVNVFINPKTLPEGDELAIDVETDEKDNPISLAICGNTQSVSVYFDIDSRIELLNELKTRKLVAHNAKADISWLEKYGFTMKHVSYDSMLAAYVLNSAEESFGLKPLCKKYLNLEWPGYNDICENEEYKSIACQNNPSLLIRKIKTYKKKPPIETTKLPKHIPLFQYPQELIANYTAFDTYACVMLMQHQKQKMTKIQKDFLEKIELPTSEVLYLMEKKGIKVDLARVIFWHRAWRRKAIKAKKAWLNQFPGTNIASPIQVLKCLKKQGLRVKDTNENTLQPYKDYPLVKILLDFREANKMCSTYTKPIYKQAAQSLDHRIHPSFFQATLTGRLSCRNPNMQNQPGVLHDIYVADEGNVLIDADFSQIELRVPAHFSNDPIMVDGFINPKKKFHQITADTLGVDYSVGKTVNFLLTNGGGVERLATIAGISTKEAQKAFDEHHKGFKGYWDWVKREQQLGKRLKGVTTLFGRFIPLPDVTSPNPKLRAYAEREIISGKVQGSAADVMKVALIRLYKKYGIIGVNVVHDEVLIEVPKSQQEYVTKLVKEVMESSAKLKVPLVSEVGVGINWAEAKK